MEHETVQVKHSPLLIIKFKMVWISTIKPFNGKIA